MSDLHEGLLRFVVQFGNQLEVSMLHLNRNNLLLLPHKHEQWQCQLLLRRALQLPASPRQCTHIHEASAGAQGATFAVYGPHARGQLQHYTPYAALLQQKTLDSTPGVSDDPDG